MSLPDAAIQCVISEGVGRAADPSESRNIIQVVEVAGDIENKFVRKTGQGGHCVNRYSDVIVGGLNIQELV